MISTDQPFVLLDDARASGAAPARHYSGPVAILQASDSAEIEALLSGLREARKDGLHAAGYFHYVAGFAIEPRLTKLSKAPNGEAPLAWFGLFEGYQEIASNAVATLLPDPAGSWLGRLQPDVSKDDYARAFDKILDFITAGDIYQANLTFRANARYAGHPLALYAAVRARAAAGYGGAIWTGEHWHLSFSPELFFALKGGRVTTKPMKGTATREADPAKDSAAIGALRNDPKQRAENLMIVDLLRNDLSRVARSGSVEVPDLFTVESYPTVHQMISTVTAELEEGADATDLLRAIYPCGSITGAPKIRAMEIIDAIEARPRGLYCGSIGRIDPSGDAAFNVAIRTFSLNDQAKQLSLGLGSGLVADSEMSAEWNECLAKGEFARVAQKGFDLIETMRFEPDQGLLRLELHLDRMKASAAALDFAFDRHEARNRLHAATFHLDSVHKVRLLASRSGALAIEIRDMPQPPTAPLRVAVVPLPVDPADFRLLHKTTDRTFYDDARKAQDCDEVLFALPDGRLTEGSFTSLYVERGDHYMTPPLSDGLLPSALRRELLESGKAVEGELRIGDLVGDFWLGNSLRGLMPAKLESGP